MFIKFTEDTRQGLLVSLTEDRIRIHNDLAELDECSETKGNAIRWGYMQCIYSSGNNHQCKLIMRNNFKKACRKGQGRTLVDHRRRCQISQLCHTSVKMSATFLGYVSGTDLGWYLLLSIERASGGINGPVWGTALLKRVFGGGKARSNILVQTGKMRIAGVCVEVV